MAPIESNWDRLNMTSERGNPFLATPAPTSRRVARRDRPHTTPRRQKNRSPAVMQDASREKRRFLNQAVRVAGGDAFEPTFSRASPDQERMGMSKEYHGRESPSKADEIFDLSLQLGKLRPRVAKTKETLQYLTQGFPEIQGALRPLLAALETEVSRCNQADLEAIFGRPAASLISAPAPPRKTRSVTMGGETRSPSQHLKTEISFLERDLVCAEKLAQQTGRLRTIARWVRRAGISARVSDSERVAPMAARGGGAVDPVAGYASVAAEWSSMRIVRDRCDRSEDAGGVRVAIPALRAKLPPPASCKWSTPPPPPLTPSLVGHNTGKERARSLSWLLGYGTHDSRSRSTGVDRAVDTAGSTSNGPKTAELRSGPPPRPCLPTPEVLLRVIYYGSPADLSRIASMSSTGITRADGAELSPAVEPATALTGTADAGQEHGVDADACTPRASGRIPRALETSDASRDSGGDNLASGRETEAVEREQRACKGRSASTSAAELVRSEVRVVVVPPRSGDGDGEECSTELRQGAPASVRPLTQLQIVVELRTSVPVAVAHVTHSGGCVVAGEIGIQQKRTTCESPAPPAANTMTSGSRIDDGRRACHGDGCSGPNADGGNDDVIPRGWSEESPELATAVAAMENNTTGLDGTAGGGDKEEEPTVGDHDKPVGKLRVGTEHLVGLNVLLPAEPQAAPGSRLPDRTPRKLRKLKVATPASLATAATAPGGSRPDLENIDQSKHRNTEVEPIVQSNASVGSSNPAVVRPKKRPRSADEDTERPEKGNCGFDGVPSRQEVPGTRGSASKDTSRGSCGALQGTMEHEGPKNEGGDLSRGAKRRKASGTQGGWLWGLSRLWRWRTGEQIQDRGQGRGQGSENNLERAQFLPCERSREHKEKEGEGPSGGETEWPSREGSGRGSDPIDEDHVLAFETSRGTKKVATVSSNPCREAASATEAEGGGNTTSSRPGLPDKIDDAPVGDGDQGVSAPSGRRGDDPMTAVPPRCPIAARPEVAPSQALRRSPLVVTVILMPPSAGEIGSC